MSVPKRDSNSPVTIQKQNKGSTDKRVPKGEEEETQQDDQNVCLFSIPKTDHLL